MRRLGGRRHSNGASPIQMINDYLLLIIGIEIDPIRVKGTLTGQANWGNHMGLPVRGNDFSIDKGKG